MTSIIAGWVLSRPTTSPLSENRTLSRLRSYRLKNKTIIFHKLCDLQSETAADESCIQKGFKDGMSLMKEILE